MTTQTKAVPTSAMSKEPAVITGGSISVALWAVLAILKAYDVVIPEDVGRNVDILLNLIAGIPAVAGFITRFLVVSPATAQKHVNAAAATGVAPDMGPPPPDEDDVPAYDPSDPDTWPDPPLPTMPSGNRKRVPMV